MSLTTESGQAVNVEEANLDFARAMTATPKDDEPIAQAPPKVEKKEPAKPAAKKPAAKKTPAKTIAAKPTDAVRAKRVQAGSDILHGMAVITESFHMATGEEAWHKDTELFAATAPGFGEAMANVAEHNPAFARYLDSEGTGAATAYFGLAVISTQITMAVIDNHNARGKIPLFFQAIGMRVRGFFGRNRKPNARSLDTARAVR